MKDYCFEPYQKVLEQQSGVNVSIRNNLDSRYYSKGYGFVISNEWACKDTGCTIICWMTLFPIDSSSCTFTYSLVTTPIIIFLKEWSDEKGVWHLVFNQSLPGPWFCWFFMLVNGCIRDRGCWILAWLVGFIIYGCRYCPQWSTFILCPCVKPPVLFRDFIKSCSMTRSELTPDMNWLLRRTIWNILNISGCLISSSPISLTYNYVHFTLLYCQAQ